MKDKMWYLGTGAAIGLMAVLLVLGGNPGNMGICAACFLRDVAGALRLHEVATVQYLRPEIVGIILGAFGAALFKGEFRPRGGANAIQRFVMGAFMMIGALVFLGCPVRMVLRLAGGDLNALVGLGGLLAGVYGGVWLLKKGYTQAKTQATNKVSGWIFPLLVLGLGGIFIYQVISGTQAAGLLAFSEKGPGASHAVWYLSLGAGLLAGILSQRSRLCMTGGFRDILLIRNYTRFTAIFGIFLLALIGNLVLGNVKVGFAGQPLAHTMALWNFLGMALVGLVGVLASGCPLRQMITAAEGDLDGVSTVFGMLFGAAIAHNFALAASPTGVPMAGQIAVLVGIAVVLAIGMFRREVS